MSISKKQLVHALGIHFAATVNTSKNTVKPKSRTKKDPTERLLVEISKQRVPLKQILNGKEIREAMAEMEKFRRRFNEEEFMLGAKVYLSYGDYECWAVIKRLETDREYEQRQQWLAQEAAKKAERARIRQLKEYEAEQKRIAEEQQRAAEEAARELERAREIVEKYGYKLVDKMDA